MRLRFVNVLSQNTIVRTARVSKHCSRTCLNWRMRLGNVIHADGIKDVIVRNASWANIGDASMRQCCG